MTPVSAATADRVVLRPQRRRSLLLLGCGVLVAVIGIGALTSGAVVLGAIAALIGVAAVVAGALRVWHPRSYALELDARGFRVYDVRGGVRHDVPWAEVQELFPTTGNAPLRPGGEVRLAWRCVPGTPGAERRRRRDGVEIDGVLPDPYGMDPRELLELMAGYSQRGPSGAAGPGSSASLTSF